MTQRSQSKARASKQSNPAPTRANENKSGAPFLASFARSGDVAPAPVKEQSINSIIRNILLSKA